MRVPPTWFRACKDTADTGCFVLQHALHAAARRGVRQVTRRGREGGGARLQVQLATPHLVRLLVAVQCWAGCSLAGWLGCSLARLVVTDRASCWKERVPDWTPVAGGSSSRWRTSRDAGPARPRGQ